MIAQAQVIVTLRPWLDARLVRALEDPMREITGMLNAYSTRRPPEELEQAVDSLLFRAIHQATRGDMLVQLPDQSWVRIRMEDVSAMADELMLLVFLELPADGRHLLFLRDYSMRRASLSALRALYTRFAPLQTEKELDAIASVVTSCYPAFRWRGWLTR